MSENLDQEQNPYVLPMFMTEKDEFEPHPRGVGCLYAFLLMLGAPIALFCLFAFFTHELIDERAFLAFMFIIGYVGIILRKRWGFVTLSIVPLIWSIQISIYLAYSTYEPGDEGLAMIFMSIYTMFIIYSMMIFLISFYFPTDGSKTLAFRRLL